jgi:hypothetical protein
MKSDMLTDKNGKLSPIYDDNVSRVRLIGSSDHRVTEKPSAVRGQLSVAGNALRAKASSH